MTVTRRDSPYAACHVHPPSEPCLGTWSVLLRRSSDWASLRSASVGPGTPSGQGSPAALPRSQPSRRRRGQRAGHDRRLPRSAGALGFDPADLRIPVTLWHGRGDRLVPLAHSRAGGGDQQRDRRPPRRPFLLQPQAPRDPRIAIAQPERRGIAVARGVAPSGLTVPRYVRANTEADRGAADSVRARGMRQQRRVRRARVHRQLEAGHGAWRHRGALPRWFLVARRRPRGHLRRPRT